MSIKEQLYEAIRNKLKAEIEDMDWEDVIDNTAQAIIEDEIGDVQKAAESHMMTELSDWSGQFGASDILNELLDEALEN